MEIGPVDEAHTITAELCAGCKVSMWFSKLLKSDMLATC